MTVGDFESLALPRTNGWGRIAAAGASASVRHSRRAGRIAQSFLSGGTLTETAVRHCRTADFSLKQAI
jgi:hypothetical protein